MPQPYQPASVSEAMMMAAMQTPAPTELTAIHGSISNRCATMAPVHAPVPGSGTPTNAATPTHRSWAPIACVFFAARLSTGDRNLLHVSDLSAARISGIGSMLPQMHRSKTCGMGRPIQRPTGMPPLNSTKGSAESTIKIAQSGKGIQDRSNKAKRWPMCRCVPGEEEAQAAWAPRKLAPTRAPKSKSGNERLDCCLLTTTSLAKAAAATRAAAPGKVAAAVPKPRPDAKGSTAAAMSGWEPVAPRTPPCLGARNSDS
mmetsp:Transcript_98515/g.283198  ORF Transcript_98515/g.283198 Transcript_98515/m.283198 type:complete len:258 (-) Transcript_98515:189-962(-)